MGQAKFSWTTANGAKERRGISEDVSMNPRGGFRTAASRPDDLMAFANLITGQRLCVSRAHRVPSLDPSHAGERKLGRAWLSAYRSESCIRSCCEASLFSSDVPL